MSKCCLLSLQPTLNLGYLLTIFSQDLEHGLVLTELHPEQVTRMWGSDLEP